jgi:hypothetical protein
MEKNYLYILVFLLNSTLVLTSAPITAEIMLLNWNSEKWKFDFTEKEYIGGEAQSKILC